MPENWEKDGVEGGEEAKWNDWRVAQVVALALEKQFNWILQKKLLSKSTEDESSGSLLSAFAHEMDSKVWPTYAIRRHLLPPSISLWLWCLEPLNRGAWRGAAPRCLHFVLESCFLICECQSMCLHTQ